MCEFVSSQKNQPIKTLPLGSCDQLTMFGSRKAKIHHLFGPVLENSCSERTLIHVRTDMVPPTRSELIKLVVRRRCVAIGVPLEIREADVHNDVNSFEFGQAFKQVERKGSKVVRIEKCEVQAILIQGLYDSRHRRTGRTRSGLQRGTEGQQSFFCCCQ
jgi:hypothetical protein